MHRSIRSVRLVAWFLVLASGPLLAADDVKKPDAKGEQEKLQGTWQAVSLERMGKPLPEPAKHRLVIEGDTLAIQRGDEVLFKGKLKLDPSKKPATLDLEVTQGPGQYKGKVSQGIYEVKGDELKWCNAEPGVEDRPKEFATNAKSNHNLIVLKRAKK
jgi:uncharacterized protein (TIGR03067 family)